MAVTPRFLQTVLRSLADIGSPVSDAELLAQFVADRSEAAFAELVRRHGRLVWTVCRNVSGSEAEADDAFQATFLVLLQNARTIREPAKLSAWLHGVAYKVCARSRQAARRRRVREEATAVREGNGFVVPDSVWDRALAAVHEEVGRLPDMLRLPFVLCCLEGKGVTEAAGQLGWKLGTFSGRLTRAKDAVLARLEARGLTVGAIAGVGLALPPAAALAGAAALARVGFVVPGSILQLTQGVIGMSMKSMKLLAAAVTLTCGLGLGTHWLARADAQPLPGTQSLDPAAEIKRLEAELAKARQAAAAQVIASEVAAKAAESEAAAVRQRQLLGEVDALLSAAAPKPSQETYTVKTTRWEYDFVVVSDMGQTKFAAFLQDRENRGWEFNGQTTLQHDGKPTGIWVFRRPAQGTSSQMHSLQPRNAYVSTLAGNIILTKPDNAKAVEAEIERLQQQLQALKAKSGRVTFAKDTLPLEPGELANLLRKMLQKRFPGRSVTITSSATSLTVEGDQQARDWAIGVVNKLAEK
jgi:RNA polymerase sigma factor (sigma-70 family)